MPATSLHQRVSWLNVKRVEFLLTEFQLHVCMHMLVEAGNPHVCVTFTNVSQSVSGSSGAD